MESRDKSPRIKLTGLWQYETPEGQSYLTGSISPALRLLVFENSYRKKTTDPHFIAYLANDAGLRRSNAPEENAPEGE